MPARLVTDIVYVPAVVAADRVTGVPPLRALTAPVTVSPLIIPVKVGLPNEAKTP